MSLEKTEVQKLLDKYDEFFLSEEGRENVLLTIEWKNGFSKVPGVYVFFNSGALVYAGETGSIQGRMNDMRNSQHHTLRRNVGSREFCDVPGFEKASSFRKFPAHIEKMVIEFLSGMEVKVLPISFGRKEIEEHLIEKYKPIYNQKTRRG